MCVIDCVNVFVCWYVCWLKSFWLRSSSLLAFCSPAGLPLGLSLAAMAGAQSGGALPRFSDAEDDHGRVITAHCGGCVMRIVFFVVGGGSIALSRRFGSEVWLMVGVSEYLAADMLDTNSCPIWCSCSSSTWLTSPLVRIVVEPLHDLIAPTFGCVGVLLHSDAGGR